MLDTTLTLIKSETIHVQLCTLQQAVHAADLHVNADATLGNRH